MLNPAAHATILALLRERYPGEENLLLRLDIRDAYEVGTPLTDLESRYPGLSTAGLEGLLNIVVHITQGGVSLPLTDYEHKIVLAALRSHRAILVDRSWLVEKDYAWTCARIKEVDTIYVKLGGTLPVEGD